MHLALLFASLGSGWVDVGRGCLNGGGGRKYLDCGGGWK